VERSFQTVSDHGVKAKVGLCKVGLMTVPETCCHSVNQNWQDV